MKKRKYFLGLLLVVTLIVCIFFIAPNGIATGVCQYCKWNNQSQEFNCAWYEGPGWFLCHAEGTDCYGTSWCDIPI